MLIDEGVEEVGTGTKTDTGQEDVDAHLAQHHVGGDGVVSHQVVARSEISDEDGDDERTAGQSEAHRSGDAGNPNGKIGDNTT